MNKNPKKRRQWVEIALTLPTGEISQKEFCRKFNVPLEHRHMVKNYLNNYFLKLEKVPCWWITHPKKSFEKLEGMIAYATVITVEQKKTMGREITEIGRDKAAARIIGITSQAKQTAIQIAEITEKNSNQRLHRLNRLELLKSIKEELEQIESIKRKLLK